MKNAIMLADTRHGLVGTVLLQLQKTNPGLYDEAIIYYVDPISEKDRSLMNSIMPCRFVKYDPPLPEELFEKPRFKRFSVLMFCRYEMFYYLDEFETITWLDTDILIQGSLKEMVESAKKTGAVFIREDPINKTAENPDCMRTCFTEPVPGYKNDEYLYCSGTIVISRKIKDFKDCTQWCYEKTVEWADILSLPDQGVLNAAIQEFNINVTAIPGKVYCCYPYMGRDCSHAVIIHTWGLNKFWNDWYSYLHFPGWGEYYTQWCDMGGSPLSFEIRPRISVVIPSFKPNLTLLKQCLDSMRNQNRNNWERFSDFEIIIVAEPVEVEPLQKMIEEIHDARIRLEINETRLGIAASLNRGLRLAKGKYIARMDDDDLCAPSRFYLQAEYLDNHPEIMLCTSDFEYFGDMNEHRISFEGGMSHAWSIFTCPFDHPTIMFRKDFFAENDLYYDEQRGYVEDWELWCRAFEKGLTVGCIHEVLFYHRWMNTGSAGQTTKTVDMMRELLQTNFRKVGVEIPTEDLALIGPWNGKLLNEADVQKVKSYFNQALEANKISRIYDQTALEKVFALRIAEVETGVLPGLSTKIQRKAPKSGAENGAEIVNPIPQGVVATRKSSLLRFFLKRFLRPIYGPIRRRYEDRIVAIQHDGWKIEGHVMNCIHKLDQVIFAQQEMIQRLMAQQALMEQQMALQQTTVQQMRLESLEKADALYNRINTVGDHLYDLKMDFQFQKSTAGLQDAGKRRIFLIGTPEHSNIGDAAITLGEREFIHQHFPECSVVELSGYDFDRWYGKIAPSIRKSDLIFLQGGGNLGNRFLNEERIRRRVIQDFPQNRIVILPQTIYFDKTEAGREELQKTQEIYNHHSNLLILTRGMQSLKMAQEYFPNADTMSSLDMALMLKTDYGFKREGILACLRDLDDESGITAEQYDTILKTVEKYDASFERTNNLNQGDANANIYSDLRWEIVSGELKKFAKRKVVVTDRLHGLIMSIITGTPCVLISAFNQKIPEFYDLVRQSNAVFFVDQNIDQIADAIQKAMNVETVSYPEITEESFGNVYRKIVQK